MRKWTGSNNPAGNKILKGLNMLKVASWNVNSLNVRLPHVLALIDVG